MSEGQRNKIQLKIFVVNVPAWLTQHERANMVLLHTTPEKALQMAREVLPFEHYHAFDFARNEWFVKHLPVPLP